jgi:hypothetical protein|eukprot:TRINITY_DN62358_c0_g1_i1.p1 TRINITY_DN62358_c0_g1~~TRINITY_DN62358_c0_g1_i1.p1  ORF type:complete len:208 (+),score=36.54 TRINITY_DN62358_c0_g1_i1:136-759(+)
MPQETETPKEEDATCLGAISSGTGNSPTGLTRRPRGGRRTRRANLAAMRRAEATARQEGIAKVKKTIGWFNQHGNLKKPIIYKTIKDVIENIEPRRALLLLKTFEEKAATIENPTYWLAKAARNDSVLDEKVRKTIGWYNSHGNLLEPIKYPEVVDDLIKLSTWEQLQIINQLEEKGSTILNPTAWICKAAQKHSSSGKGAMSKVGG